jgi:hypothetical protein
MDFQLEKLRLPSGYLLTSAIFLFLSTITQMSSSKHNPLQDITNDPKLGDYYQWAAVWDHLLSCRHILISAIYADPKEVKRQRDREYYARNKDEISKRRRQARELKKASKFKATCGWRKHNTGDSTIRSHPIVEHNTCKRSSVLTSQTSWMRVFVKQNYVWNTDLSSALFL